MKASDDDRKWKVLKSEYLFKRPWLTARRDEVELPNGARNPEYYVLEYPNWVNVLAITRDGKFLMVRQYRHGLGKTCYELCAGVCEATDASPLDAARRELLEETGYFYGASAEIREENFPTRVYGDLTLAEGVYDALIIELGTGTGDNWWCVLYPPLCFTSSSQDVEYRSIILDIISDFFD